MAITDVADQYFTYESRLGSFQTAQQLSKRRASNANSNSKTPKSMKWPHKFLSPQELAKAGFFYFPLQTNPDNVACFLCHKSLDGWEENDDPLAEHLKHSPECGWAIVATIEKQDEELSHEYPLTSRMNDARKATFGDKWPHENKKGWKCKVKQMVEAGWKYTPTPEYDDMATCAYCSLALDGWEPADKPLDEHYNRSPDCAFFTLINSHKQTPKRTKSKRDRTSKASRLSTQSSFTVASEGQSLADLPAEDDDSILTTATNATQTGKKMGKGKKPANTKSKKTRAKKGEPVEVDEAPEPEDADFEVKVDPVQKPTRGRKRKSDPENGFTQADVEVEAPPPKRRATRTRGSIAINDSVLQDEASTEIPKLKGRKGRPSKSARKASTASVALLHASVPDDDEIDKALEADIERQMTDEDKPGPPSKKGTRASKVSKADHAMFGTDNVHIDEAAIEAELEAMEIDSKPLPKAKGARGKQTRKPSAKQQAAAKKAAEAVEIAEVEAEAQRLAEEEASQQIASELEHSISMQHSSPIIQPKRQRAASRQSSRQAPGRATKASVVSINDSNVEMADSFQNAVDGQNEDSGNDTDASIASQSTVVRGGSTRRGSSMKKGRGGKKAVSRNIEEIVHKEVEPVVEVVEEARPSRKSKRAPPAEDVSLVEENIYTPAPEVAEALEEGEQPAAKAKATKGRGRPPKATPRPQIQQTLTAMEYVEKDPKPALSKMKQTQAKSPIPAPRSPIPSPEEATPSQSPQSSDAENHPPSSKPSVTAKQSATHHLTAPQKAATPHTTTTRIPLASTPIVSPSKRNIIAGLQSVQPWTAVDLDTIFMKSPTGDENAKETFGDAITKAKNGGLTSPEKKMSVEEWILYNAGLAEEKLRVECEGMVGLFEREGGRAMRALEGVDCVE